MPDGLEELDAMLAQQRLAIAELPRVLRDVRDAEGADEAFQMGEQALSYTEAADVLDAMATLADEVGQPERAARWRAQLERQKERGDKQGLVPKKGLPRVLKRR